MNASIIDDITTVPADEWNALSGTSQPFLRHEFLATLESTCCVGRDAGWAPCHVLLRDDAGKLTGAMPLYGKTNSWGEFVFDWAWADAYRRAGIRYYPKLVSAIPFTPAPGPRCLIAAGQDRAAVMKGLIEAALGYADRIGASSLHILFPSPEQTDAMTRAGLLLRKDCQFHWRNAGYASFDEFLGEFTAAKRKKVRRERRRVQEAGVQCRLLDGHSLDSAAWEKIMPLYASSFWRRGRDPYLTEEFFVRISGVLPENILVVLAEFQAEPIATAICFRGADTLYGRYWGSTGRYHSLHFETCYYQGIEYCINHGISCFEPGTQGEHKISRGFVPTETWSAHWLSHPQFAAAIDEYLGRERDYIDEYITAARDHVPYRKHAN